MICIFFANLCNQHATETTRKACQHHPENVKAVFAFTPDSVPWEKLQDAKETCLSKPQAWQNWTDITS